ncbi:hypothetical protein XENOCAPTIV_007729 [Xenoophorus captivus]|uniref:Uncharacterized protein n=1 Tax=Xenoophorus captivus TaxID=1517983 RepID=A0ABV0SGA4_9TELE
MWSWTSQSHYKQAPRPQVRSPLLRQRKVICSEDELSETSDKAENAELLTQQHKPKAPHSPQILSDSTLTTGLTPRQLCERESVSGLHTVTLKKREDETFGVDLEIMSSPLRVMVAGLKPDLVAEWVPLNELQCFFSDTPKLTFE